MEIKRTVELKELSEKLHEIGHNYGLHIEPTVFDIINVNGKDAAKIPVQNAAMFYKLLIEDLVDDMLPIIEDEFYKMVIVKYVDEEFGKKMRERNKYIIKDYALMPALVVYAKSLYFNLNKESILAEGILEQFELRNDVYIKTFGSEQERMNFILSIDSANRIIVAPIEVLINPTDYVLL